MPNEPEASGVVTDVTRSNAWKGYALAALAATAWATGGLTAKWLFSPLDAATSVWPFPPPGLEVDPTTLAGARAIVSALLLLGYLLLRKRDALKIDRGDVPFLAVFGIVGLAGVHVAYFLAISHTNVATAILLEYLAPVLTLLFAVLFLGLTRSQIPNGAVVLSVIGAALVVGVLGGDGLAISTAGLFWGLAAAVMFAAYSLMGRFAAARYSPWTLLCYGLIFAALFWLAFLGGPKSMLEFVAEPVGAVAIVYLAVVSTIIPFGAFLKALHYIEPTKALITSTLEPVIAGFAAWLLLGEVFSPLQLLGGLLVIAAIAVVQQSPASMRTESTP